MQIVPYEPKQKEQWCNLVGRSRNGTFLHQREYMEYHSERFVDKSLLFFRGNCAVAALPASIKEGTLTSHEGLTYGGLIVDFNLHAWEVLSIFQNLVEWGRSNGIRRLVYKTIPHIYHRLPAEEDLYALNRVGAKLHRRDMSTCIPILNQPPPISKGRRSCVSKGKRNGIKVIETSDYERFMEIATLELQAKHGVKPTHSAEELLLLSRRFPEHIKLIGGYINSRLLGGVILYLTDTVCHVQYIASTLEGRKEGVIDVCVEHAIMNFCITRRWFDFGISTISQGLGIDLGLILNKESWGGRTVVFDQYLLEFEEANHV